MGLKNPIFSLHVDPYDLFPEFGSLLTGHPVYSLFYVLISYSHSQALIILRLVGFLRHVQTMYI